MADTRIQLFDGTTLAFPQGTAQDVIDRVAKQETFSRKAIATNAAQAAQARNGVSGGSLMQAGIDPTEGNSFAQNFFIGAGKAISDTGQGIKQLVADTGEYISPTKRNLSSLITGNQPESFAQRLRRETDETKRRDEPLMNTGGGVVGDIAGNVGMALLPGGLLKGAAAIQGARGAAGAAEALNVAGGALIVPRTILGAGAQGATLGAIQPVGTDDERSVNALIGGAAGAAIPAVITGYRGAKSLIDPLTSSGRAQILGRALQEASGGDVGLLARLRGAQELVPGSLPTVGETANNASVAALQRSAFASTPEVKNAVVERVAQQNTARVGELLDLAGNQGQRDLAEAVRDLMTDEFFKQARLKGINPEVAKMMQPQIDNLMERMPSGVIEKAKEIARIKGETMGKEGSVSGLHWIKKGVDEMIATSGQSGLGPQMKQALTQFKSDLLKTVEELSPDYMKGSRNFRTFSAPLNEMDTVAEIVKRSVSGINDRLTPAAYARALRDETAQKATGFKGATLENTMSPNFMSRLNAIRDDLKRADFAANAGRSGSDTVEKLAYNNMLAQTGVPNFLRNFAPTQFMGNLATSGANLLYGNANKTLQKQLAEALLDPKEAAKLLETATPSQRGKLLATILRGTATQAAIAAPASRN